MKVISNNLGRNFPGIEGSSGSKEKAPGFSIPASTETNFNQEGSISQQTPTDTAHLFDRATRLNPDYYPSLRDQDQGALHIANIVTRRMDTFSSLPIEKQQAWINQGKFWREQRFNHKLNFKDIYESVGVDRTEFIISETGLLPANESDRQELTRRMTILFGTPEEPK